MSDPKPVVHHLTREDAAYVARLARIDLGPEELDTFAVQLAAVLDHAAQVAAIDTSAVEPTSHPLPLVNVLRADEPRPCLDRDEVLSQAPVSESGRFRVPRVLGDAP
jgi:aspartyl-tRNA(Asn)/glutamyl-tRNA(Gln) amidotransferase subunit C